MKKKNLKFLIIGYGSIGFRHAQNLIKLGYKNISVLRTYKNKFKFKKNKKLKFFSKFKKTLNNKKDHIMIIANPTKKHVPYVIKGLKEKMNIYIEKPLSDSLKEIDKVKKLEKKNNSKIFIGYQFRYHPGLLYIKKCLKEKKLGKIYSVSSDVGEYLPSWHPWENYKNSYASQKKLGGGVVLTLAHEIDYLYWLFGNFKSIYSLGGKFTKLSVDVEDNVITSILTKSNVPINLRMDYWRNPPSRKLNIVGEKGEITWDYYKGTTTFIRRNGKKILKKNPKNWNRNSMFIDSINDFIDCVTKHKKSKIVLSDGIYGLKAALAIKKSLSVKQKIIM